MGLVVPAPCHSPATRFWHVPGEEPEMASGSMVAQLGRLLIERATRAEAKRDRELSLAADAIIIEVVAAVGE